MVFMGMDPMDETPIQRPLDDCLVPASNYF